MRALRVALSPLLAAWLMLLAGIAPAHCLLRLSVTQDLCAPSAAFEADDRTSGAQHVVDMPCLVFGSLPGIAPPGPPALAGALSHPAPVPAIVVELLVRPAPAIALPPVRAPPAHA
jgi:hypothetical protein